MFTPLIEVTADQASTLFDLSQIVGIISFLSAATAAWLYSFVYDKFTRKSDLFAYLIGALVLAPMLGFFAGIVLFGILYVINITYLIALPILSLFPIAYVLRGVVRLNKAIAEHKKDKEAHK